jgi:hypothetical protein
LTKVTWEKAATFGDLSQMMLPADDGKPQAAQLKTEQMAHSKLGAELIRDAAEYQRHNQVIDGPLMYYSTDQKFKPMPDSVWAKMDDAEKATVDAGKPVLDAKGRKAPRSKPAKTLVPSAPVPVDDARLARQTIADIEWVEDGDYSFIPTEALKVTYYRCDDREDIERLVGAELDRRGIDTSV